MTATADIRRRMMQDHVRRDVRTLDLVCSGSLETHDAVAGALSIVRRLTAQLEKALATAPHAKAPAHTHAPVHRQHPTPRPGVTVRILSVLARSGRPMRVADVCDVLEETDGSKSTGVLIAQAAGKGLLERVDKGLYVITPAGREKLSAVAHDFVAAEAAV